MKPRPLTLLVTSAKVSFWISLTPVVFILASLTRLQIFTEVPDYLLEDTGMIYILGSLFLTAMLPIIGASIMLALSAYVLFYWTKSPMPL